MRKLTKIAEGFLIHLDYANKRPVRFRTNTDSVLKLIQTKWKPGELEAMFARYFRSLNPNVDIDVYIFYQTDDPENLTIEAIEIQMTNRKNLKKYWRRRISLKNKNRGEIYEVNE